MKAGKIIRNSLLGIVGLVLVLLVILQVALRPAVLTGVVNRIAAGFVEGDVNFTQVRAHVIKSFPFLNVEASDFSITYPHGRYQRYDSLYAGVRTGRRNLMKAGYGEQSDTLVSVRKLIASVDYTALLKGAYNIRRLELERPRIFAHYYDSTAANWDILPIGSPSGEAEDKADSARLQLQVRRIALTDRPLIVYTNPVDTLHGLFTLRRMELDGQLNIGQIEKTDARLQVDSLFVSGRLPQDTLSLRLDRLRASVEQRNVRLDADAKASLRTRSFGRLRVPVHLDADACLPELAKGEIGADIRSLHVNLSRIPLEGSGQIYKRQNGILEMDVQAAIKDCPLGELIEEYEENIPFLQKITTDAILSLDARAKGCYGQGQTPVIEASLLLPPATVDYDGLGRKGRLALDAALSTDNIQEVNADVDRLFVDIVGARIDLNGSVKDLLGKDPLLGLNGSIHARADSLTRAFTRDMGLSATGSIDARLSGRARLSQLSLAKIGQAGINCDLTARNLSVDMPKDSISALLPQLDMNLATKTNSIDQNLSKKARVLALKADADTLDVNIGSMYVRGGGVQLLLQNSADILKGGKNLTALMGLLKVNNLRLKDGNGLSLGLRNNTETFRVEPATQARPHARLKLTSDSGRLRVRSGENMFALREAKFDVAASRHQVRQRDTTRRRRMQPRKPDDFASSDIRINLGESMRKYIREWDIEGNLDLGSGRMVIPAFPLKTRLSHVKGSFDNDTLELHNITVQAGASDLSAQARLTGLRRALIGRGRSRLKLKADVQSNYIDANELMRGYAYYTSYVPAKDLSGASDEAVESAVEQAALPDSTGSRLLVIPSNLEVDFSLEASGIKYDSLLVSWAAADVAMRNHTLQVTNAVAASNMGDIYFEGFYATRAKDDLKAGFDLNLVDITAEKVITLFPAVDSILPMLTSFAGDLDCELAATTDIDTLMNLVKPSIDGVLKISGKDLSLRDSREFTKIANMLMFRDRNKAHIDNMAVTGMVRNNILEVFPFVLNVDRYQLAASGVQNLDSQFRYHISVLRSPLLVKFGLNAWGPDFNHIHYSLGKAQYRNANVPVFTQQLDTVQYSLVAAIHNIFELGVEKAMEENRTAQYLSPQSSLGEVPEEAAAPEALDAVRERLSGIVEETDSRRDALREEVVRLAREAAVKKDPYE